MNDHTLIRATLATAVIGILAAHWGVGEDEAMRRFYESKTALAFADDETGLYGMSALNIAGACANEYGILATATLTREGASALVVRQPFML